MISTNPAHECLHVTNPVVEDATIIVKIKLHKKNIFSFFFFLFNVLFIISLSTFSVGVSIIRNLQNIYK